MYNAEIIQLLLDQDAISINSIFTYAYYNYLQHVWSTN